MKQSIVFSFLLGVIPYLFAGGVGSTDGDIAFYIFLSFFLLFTAGAIALGRFVIGQLKTIAWIPYPYFIYMFSFWRKYC